MTMAEQPPPTDSSEEKPGLRSVLGHFLPLEAAASWIAFGTFIRNGFEWPMPFYCIFDQDDFSMEEDFARNEGRYFFAFEMLSKAIGSGLVAAYGRYYEPEPGEEAAPRATDVLADGRTRRILDHEARASFFNLGGDDECIAVGSHIYDLVVVNWHDLQKAFGPLTKEGNKSLSVEAPPQREAHVNLSETEMRLNRRGRPPKWDWDRINLEIILLANQPNGLPDTQAELENWVATKCNDLFGSEPGISTIRSKIGPIYRRLRLKG